MWMLKLRYVFLILIYVWIYISILINYHSGMVLPEHFFLFQSLGNSQKEYERCIVNFSIKNQLRYRGNLVRFVRKDERRYYEDLLAYSRENLMLYPYHLSDVVVKGLRVTPFQYYISMMETIMEQEKSYDSLPNFTAADCNLISSLD